MLSTRGATRNAPPIRCWRPFPLRAGARNTLGLRGATSLSMLLGSLMLSPKLTFKFTAASEMAANTKTAVRSLCFIPTILNHRQKKYPLLGGFSIVSGYFLWTFCQWRGRNFQIYAFSSASTTFTSAGSQFTTRNSAGASHLAASCSKSFGAFPPAIVQ